MSFSKFGPKGRKKFYTLRDLPEPYESLSELQEADWSDEICYGVLIKSPQIRDLIRRHAGLSKKVMSANAFLGLCDRAFSPSDGVFNEKAAEVAQTIYEKFDLTAGQFQSKFYSQPSGKVLVALLCSLALHGDKLRKVSQCRDGCVLEASIPDDRWSFEGELLVSVIREKNGTLVEAATVLDGQWHKRKNCLNKLLSDLEKIPPAVSPGI